MGRLFEFSQLMRSQDSPDKGFTPAIVEGLPSQLLTEYRIRPQSFIKNENSWYLESEHGPIMVWKYNGELERLMTALKWQDYLNRKKLTGVLKILKTQAGKLYEEIEGNVYYAALWRKKADFKGEKNEILWTAEMLGKLHKLSQAYIQEIETKHEKKNWPQIMQERLTDLLTYLSFLKKESIKTDFERIYTENFDLFYDQGQEALQNIIVAEYKKDSSLSNKVILVNSFSPNDIAVIDKQVVYLNLLNWGIGLPVMDLALFINSYMPVHRWEFELTKKILVKYCQNFYLNEQDKQLLKGYLRFPNRLWLYSYQYFNGLEKILELTQKLKSYVHECYLRDQCLDLLDEWLEEGEICGI